MIYSPTELAQLAVKYAEDAYHPERIGDRKRFRYKNGIEGFLDRDEQYEIISFAGSNEHTDWEKVNLQGQFWDFFQTNQIYPGFLGGYLEIKRCFWDLVFQTNPSLNSFFPKISSIIEQKDEQQQAYLLTGHSSGAAIATLAALDFASYGLPVILVTFAQPKMGKLEEKKLQNLQYYLNVWHVFDLLANLPVIFSPRYGLSYPIFSLTHRPHLINNHARALGVK